MNFQWHSIGYSFCDIKLVYLEKKGSLTLSNYWLYTAETQKVYQRNFLFQFVYLEPREENKGIFAVCYL
jgi:hypothetical protein